MEDPIEVNRAGWNLRTAIHLESDFYNLKGWKAGQCSLQAIEKQEVGDVQGLDLLHLQCHFGLDVCGYLRLSSTYQTKFSGQRAMQAV